MHGRYKKIVRTVSLIADLLSGKSHDRETAARRLGIQVAAADRQLRAVMNLPGVIAEKVGGRRVVRFDPRAAGGTPSVATAIAACFGASLGPLFRGTAYESAMMEARELVLRLARRRRAFKDIDRKFLFLHRGGEISLPDCAGQLDDLIEGVLAHRWIGFQYLHFDGRVDAVRVQPLSLAVYEHQLYLIGRDAMRKLRPFRFARIRSLELEGSSFEYPERAEYDPDQVFAASFGVFLESGRAPERVQLLLNRRWMSHVQSHRWHRSQHVSLERDGIHLSVDVRVCPEVVRWVLGFGEDAEVLAPPALRNEIAERASRLCRLYEGAPRGSG